MDVIHRKKGRPKKIKYGSAVWCVGVGVFELCCGIVPGTSNLLCFGVVLCLLGLIPLLRSQMRVCMNTNPNVERPRLESTLCFLRMCLLNTSQICNDFKTGLVWVHNKLFALSMSVFFIHLYSQFHISNRFDVKQSPTYVCIAVRDDAGAPASKKSNTGTTSSASSPKTVSPKNDDRKPAVPSSSSASSCSPSPTLSPTVSAKLNIVKAEPAKSVCAPLVHGVESRQGVE